MSDKGRWSPEDFDDMAKRLRALNDYEPLADDWASMAEQASRDLRATNTIKVDHQGVLFGKNFWSSHEKITGETADQLNRRYGFGKGYMEWMDALATDKEGK